MNIFFEPQEMVDAVVITKLSQYGRVLGCRRGHWQSQPGWENVIRHARMEVKTPIPSFRQIGSNKVMVKYEGQIPTCRNCGKSGHLAAGCSNTTCFNCGEAGHLSANCKQPKRCSICNYAVHLTRDCPSLWRNQTR